jgi:hypothetical protein
LATTSGSAVARTGGISAHPLTHVRRQRGWTLADVAAIVARGRNMSAWAQKVNRWERGGVIPERVAQYALANELGINQALVNQLGWPRWLLTLDIVEQVDSPWSTARARNMLANLVEAAAMDRRGFLVLSGQVLATAAGASLAVVAQPVLAGADGATVGGELVAAMRTRIEQLWHLDDLLGGGACLPAALSDLRLTTTVLKKATFTGAAERQLLSVAASSFRFAGFAAFDAGLNAAGQRLWHGGLRAAHAGGDTGEAVYILSNLALQDIYANRGRDALDLLDAAEAHVDLASKTVLAMLYCWRARAHAVRAEPAQAAAALNHADDLYDQRHIGDDPDWIYWMPRPSATAEAGTAILETGQPQQAERMLTDGMAGLPTGAARERNLYLARIAEAQLAAGNLDQAADTARQAIDAGAAIDSTRVAEHTRKLLRLFPRHDPHTAKLREAREASRE